MTIRRPGLFALVMAVVSTASLSAEAPPALRALPTIRLAGVEGRIDHLAIDEAGKRLFVAALGNNTLEVLDIERACHLHSITGLREPQGVAYLPALGQIAVANGDDGSCRFFDSRTFQPGPTVDCQGDADNLRYDAQQQRLYVGWGQGTLSAVDLKTMTRTADIPLAGHPESFQLETQGNRIFVNVPAARCIQVLDRRRNTVLARWPLETFQANFPMALDEARQRLIIGCRKPARLVVLDAQSGKTVASLPCPGDTDDVFYDPQLRRVYVSGGEGSVGVFSQLDADHYQPLATIATAPGARTSLFVPALRRLFVAVPHRGQQPAEIRQFATPEPIEP